ncbi:MAG: polysaccharide biosynthesis tyrosine autokinase [Symploca sp. SIO2C1]|nr:polysaccharide biosynthesis tyrosine autokinase [Symploca sp. SIO2C1]
MTPDTEQNYQILSVSKQSRTLQQVPLEEEVEFNDPPKKGLNLGPILRTVQRKILLIIGITSLTTAAGAFLSSKSPSLYQGSFQMLVEPVTSEAKRTDPGVLIGGEVKDAKGSELDYSTIFEILTGSGTLSDIAEEVQLEYPDFSTGQLKGGLAVERVASAQFKGDTKLIQISYVDLDGEIVESVLKKTADKYLKYSLEERKSRIDQGVKFIDDQIPGLQSRVDTLQAKLQKLQKQYNLIDPASQGGELFTKVREIETEQSITQRELEELNALELSLRNQLNLTPNEAIAASALSEDPTYQQLITQLKTVEGEIATESVRFQPDSPQMEALEEKRQNFQNLINQEILRILGQNTAGAVDNPQVLAFQNPTRLALITQMIETTNQIQVLETRNQAIGKLKNEVERQAEQFPAVAGEYNGIQRQLDVTTKTLDQLLTQRETLRVEAAQNTVPWELIAPPKVPRDPDGNPVAQPGDSKKLMLGAVGGLLLGVVLAILYEKLRNIFYSTEDIKDTIELPLLGEIPLEKSLKRPTLAARFGRAIEETHNSYPATPLFLEAFESLYANIRFRFSEPPVGSLVICSAGSGDGKSVIALNLAQTAAAMGQQVLLVDANLRSPVGLDTQLGLPNSEGLSDLLENRLTSSELLERSRLTEHLFVLTSGQPLLDSPKRLASSLMQHLMEKFQARFDLVIYDTPNLTDYTDASFLAANADGILLVAAVRKTKQSLVKQSLEQLNTFGLPILGVVANRVKPSSLSAPPQPPPGFSHREEVAEEFVPEMQEQS